MKYNFQYQSGARSFEPKFGRVINATDGGFERGYAQGYTEGETAGTERAEASNAVILADCNAVLPDKGVETADSLGQVPQRIGEIESPNDWHKYSPYIRSLQGTFETATFPVGTEMVLNVPNFSAGTASFMRLARNIKKVTLICDDWYSTHAEAVTVAANNMFYCAYELQTLDLSRFKVRWGYCANMFYSCTALREILGELDFSKKSGTAFGACSALVEVRFVAGSITANLNLNASSKLSSESIQSIIDGLVDLTGATAQTLTLHPTVGAKLTEAQKETVAAKNWTLVY